jgi:hypothetical protein
VTELVSTQYHEDDTAVPSGGLLWDLVALPDWLLLGGAYRQGMVARLGDRSSWRTFPEEADLFGQVEVGDLRAGGSLGVGRCRWIAAPAAQVTPARRQEFVSRTHRIGWDVGGR